MWKINIQNFKGQETHYVVLCLNQRLFCIYIMGHQQHRFENLCPNAQTLQDSAVFQMPADVSLCSQLVNFYSSSSVSHKWLMRYFNSSLEQAMKYFPIQPMNYLSLGHMATFDVQSSYLPLHPPKQKAWVAAGRGKLGMAVNLKALFSLLYTLTSILVHPSIS